MKIAIIGFDTEGRATYDYFSSLDASHEITICDQKETIELPDGTAAVLGEHYLDNLDRFDLIIRTAGMHPHKIIDKNPDVAGKISTHINEFLKACPSSNIIGVTGTKGKGTTSTLITNILEASGKAVRLGGNIGVPPLSFINEIDKKSWVVLELSSFQLIDLQHSPHIAVCLMVVPEHLDWHTDMEEYITSKEQLFARQGTADTAIYYHGNETSKRIAAAGQAQKVPYYHAPGAEVVDSSIVIDGHEICRTDELKLLGEHNWQNACAAVTAVWYACQEVCEPSKQPDSIAAMRNVLTSFSGLPFRLEFRGEIHGRRFYNDSFSSAPPAPIAAVQAIQGPSVLIVGGFDRMLDLADMSDKLAACEEKLRAVLVIGQARARITEVFESRGFTNYTISNATTMQQIVADAVSLSQQGDAIILSPGFPSFDMFQNFKDRGEQFNRAVENI